MMRWIDTFLPVFEIGCELSVSPCNHTEHLVFFNNVVSCIDSIAKNTTAPQDEFENALFAVVSWLDEQVLKSSVSFSHSWRGNMLQSHYFNSTIAGTAFFERLENIEKNSELSILYIFSILMGFKGKFNKENDSVLDDLIECEMSKLSDKWDEWPKTIQLPSYLSPVNAVYRKKKHNIGWGKLFLVNIFVYVFLFLLGTFCFIQG